MNDYERIELSKKFAEKLGGETERGLSVFKSKNYTYAAYPPFDYLPHQSGLLFEMAVEREIIIEPNVINVFVWYWDEITKIESIEYYKDHPSKQCAVNVALMRAILKYYGVE